MHTILLTSPGKRIIDLQKGLASENIFLKSKLWDSSSHEFPRKLIAEIIEYQSLLLYINPDDIPKILSELRRLRAILPVVVLGEEENLNFKRRIFEFGAQGYFSPPFPYRTIATHLKKIREAPRTNGTHKWLHAFDIWLDLEHRIAKRDQQKISLRNKEFSLLEFFIINRGKVLTRNTLLEYVWDRNANFASNTVDVHINRLRRKIDDPFKEKLIHTVHCVGYMFERKKKEKRRS